MFAVRLYTARYAWFWKPVYTFFEAALRAVRPLIDMIGRNRLEPVFAATEKAVKGTLFGCQMCGNCVLSSTGLSCPMNCPKSLRNGPCGGVRQNGNCEVKPAMRCVWVVGADGAMRIGGHGTMLAVNTPADASRRGRSAWLGVLQPAGNARDA